MPESLIYLPPSPTQTTANLSSERYHEQSVLRPLFICARFVNAVVISHAAFAAADLLDTTSQSHNGLRESENGHGKGANNAIIPFTG